MNIAEFKIDNKSYIIVLLSNYELILFRSENIIDEWSLEPEEHWYTADLNDTRKSVSVLRRCVKEVDSWIKKTKPPYLYFVASSEAKKRIFENFFVKRMDQYPGYDYSQDGKAFYIYKVNKADD
jgi:hypothetical protein